MRIRPVLLAAVLAASVAGVPSASAEYPNVCHAGGVEAAPALLVATAPGADAAVRAAVSDAGGRYGARLEPLGVRQAAFGSAAARDGALALLRRLPGVRWAEPDRVVRAHRTANDPYARHQWAIDRIGLRRAWDVETGDAGVVVAVLDTGVAAGHPDLKGKVLPGIDVVNDDKDADDDHGHGTHVAGTVAAASNNKRGVTGVAWGARVLPVKVLGAEGSGSTCDVVVGMVEAARAGAHVLNMSLGANYPCPLAFQAAVEYASTQDTLVVASSGNDGLQGAAPSAPGNCEGVLSVGATDSKDKPALFTTFGPQVDVSAPGAQIVSTFVDPKRKTYGYIAASGTSMAAPHVAGLAALIRSKHPDWTSEQVFAVIVDTADDLGAGGPDDFYGAGRINAAAALKR
jgi:subtilisin family serine protease